MPPLTIAPFKNVSFFMEKLSSDVPSGSEGTVTYQQSNLSEDNLNSNQVLLTKRTVVNKPTISYPCDFKMI
jgi:hypothetical protein